MEYKTYPFNSFNLYTIKTDKFKNCHLEVVFRRKVQKENIVLRKFLMEILSYSTSDYPNQIELNKHLEDLYNTSFYGLLSRVGNCLLTSFCYDFLNPKYCENNFLTELLNFVIAVIFKPNIFDENNFKLIKNNLLNEVRIKDENPKVLAYRHLFKNIDENMPLSYDMVGTNEEVENVTISDLKEEYSKLLEEDYCDIYLVGNLDMDKIADFFENKFANRIVKNYDLDIISSPKIRNTPKVKKETASINQANLLIGCNLVNPTLEQRDIIAYLYNYMLGGGSLNNKLAKYLRCDNSLCYTTNSIYQKYDSIIILYAGIAKKNYNKALSLMKKALKEMVNKITTEELEDAKKGLITSLNMIEDNESSLINNYLFCNIAHLEPVEKRIAAIRKVTKEDIKKFAKKVKINTIYMLSGVK